ncbi:hypothetical protein CCHR01_16208 [Colletotrichum chrysophilum]|uniref:Uncharacterized protein n=1 Tax=Colletotrichum chrysophilum TaxID=1836956 RepID=A0AAD9A477_9PEZI|nr:hypothetical protein CCHR01_16208 [Colletotrichum chrysophilum]
MSPSHAIEDYLHVRRWDRRQTQSNEEAQPHRDVSVRSNFQLYLDGPAVQQLQAIDRCRVTEVRWRLASLPVSFLRPSVPLIAHALWTHRGSFEKVTSFFSRPSSGPLAAADRGRARENGHPLVHVPLFLFLEKSRSLELPWSFNLELELELELEEDGGVVDQGLIKLLEMMEVEGSGYWDENEASNNRWKQTRTLKTPSVNLGIR